MQLKKVLKGIDKGLDDLMDEELDKQSDELVSGIINTHKTGGSIYVYGAGRSGYIGRAFVMRLVQCGFKGYFIGESSTPPLKATDLLILISGSGQTPTINMILNNASTTHIVLITSQPLTSEQFTRVIAIKGQNKMENESAVLPLGSSFEINAFLYLECLIAKMIDDYPPARDEIRKVSQRYNEGKMIVF